MTIDDKSFFILAANRNSLVIIAKLFGLTEDEINNPNCGAWIADCIKQYQTSNILIKSMKLRNNENTNVETYNPDPLQEKPNPLLPPEETTE